MCINHVHSWLLLDKSSDTMGTFCHFSTCGGTLGGFAGDSTAFVCVHVLANAHTNILYRVINTANTSEAIAHNDNLSFTIFEGFGHQIYIHSKMPKCHFLTTVDLCALC